MNRIILIGNGFDRAHELPTSYEQFIADFWDMVILDSRDSYEVYEDDLKITKIVKGLTFIKDIIPDNCERSRQGINNKIKDFNSKLINRSHAQLIFNNKFLDKISSHLDEQKWVDIENDYYSELKGTTTNILYSKRQTYEDALNLNKELSIIECLLKEYLIKVTENTEINNSIKRKISEKIYSSFQFQDFSFSQKRKIITILCEDLKSIFSETGILLRGSQDQYREWVNKLRDKYRKLPYCNPFYSDQIIYNSLKTLTELTSDIEILNYIESKYNHRDISFILSEMLYPNEILLLDFNYTNTTSCYKDNHADTEIIHIHGELNNPKNPMIFGYGDEIGEDYQKIENLEENELLKNIKSIRYQDTNNYQKLMEFIESDHYQVFVMGHSCGNSDRTLLNTLFEHENCLSIKPYYYQYGEKEGDNNYSDIVRNISRNFRDKPSMRNKVVNKTYCEPLLEFKKSNT